MATWALCISSASWAHARDVPTSHAGIAWSLAWQKGLAVRVCRLAWSHV